MKQIKVLIEKIDMIATRLMVLRSITFRYCLFCFFSLLSPISLSNAQILDKLNDSDNEEPVTIEAEESVVCNEGAHKCVATGLAKAQKGTSTIYGDVLTVYFTEGKKRDITAMMADGHVRMETPTETAFGDHAHYDVALDRVRMTGGNLKIITPKEILTAQDSIEYWHTDHKGIACGNAIAQFPQKEQLVQADTLIAYFKPSTKISEAKKEKLQIDRVEAEGNMLASGPNGIVTGDRGVYFGDKDLVEVFDNVRVTQDQNLIEGGYARANLKTNVAEIYPHPPHVSSQGAIKRISGIIIPKDAKKRKDKELKSSERSLEKQKNMR